MINYLTHLKFRVPLIFAPIIFRAINFRAPFQFRVPLIFAHLEPIFFAFVYFRISGEISSEERSLPHISDIDNEIGDGFHQ